MIPNTRIANSSSDSLSFADSFNNNEVSQTELLIWYLIIYLTYFDLYYINAAFRMNISNTGISPIPKNAQALAPLAVTDAVNNQNAIHTPISTAMIMCKTLF
jgi:hypothetical protein